VDTLASIPAGQLAVALVLLAALAAIVIRPTLLLPEAGADWLQRHTDAVDAIPPQTLGVAIALAAALGLYAELMIIRLHGSYFQLFAYFKNVSLLSCFLGLGIGYARGNRRPLATPLVLPAMAVQIAFLHVLRRSAVADSLQNPIAEQFSLGMERATALLPAAGSFAFVLLIFAANALCFVPLGHLAARLMARQPSLRAYGWNLAGSLAGIALFALVSFAWAPPVVWLVLVAAGLAMFLRTEARALAPTFAALAFLVVLLARPGRLNETDIYSPYQILTLTVRRSTHPELKTSNAYYQRILDLRESRIGASTELRQWADYYGLPYRFKPRPARVLVVGSGTGNDVASALRHGAGAVDAVEIDPAILSLGRLLHPEAPYQHPAVTARVNDARAHLRSTDQRYDLIVYGLLDSHTLLSGASGGIRLDSYVYTVEGFREARARLRPGGMLSVTFSILGHALGRKMYLMLQQAFDGRAPLVYEVGYDGGFTFLAGDSLPAAPDSLPATLRNVTDGYAVMMERGGVDVSTDDWPFFYMRAKTYPTSYAAMIGLLLGVSLLAVRRLVPGARDGFSWPCFFLGAGFMLVETKAITELALVYGSTWVVTSAVIAAILVLAFLANLVVMRVRMPPQAATYGLLAASLLLGLALTIVGTGGLPLWGQRVAMTAVLTLPLFFSGFAFSTELQRTGSVAVALSANLLGAMLGGFLEYNAMYFGFRSLYVFGLVLYALAYVASIRAGRVRA
jgi:hypothetical protein